MLQKRLHNIAIAFLSLLLAWAIVIPSALKLNHLLQEPHQACQELHKTHFHELDIDCKLFDFQHNNLIFHIPEDFSITVKEVIPHSNYAFYDFLSEFQYRHFTLRGPPRV